MELSVRLPPKTTQGNWNRTKNERPWNFSAIEYADYRCQVCGSDRRKLHVYHLDKNRQNNDLKNLMVLCQSCHFKLHNSIRLHAPKMGKLSPHKRAKIEKLKKQAEYLYKQGLSLREVVTALNRQRSHTWVWLVLHKKL